MAVAAAVASDSCDAGMAFLAILRSDNFRDRVEKLGGCTFERIGEEEMLFK